MRGEYERREMNKSRQRNAENLLAGGNKMLTEPAAQNRNRDQSNMEAIIRADQDTLEAAAAE